MRRSLLPAAPPPAALLALLALLGPATAHAYVPRLSFEEMARRSRLVVTGRVVDVRSYRAPFGEAGEVMFTDVTVQIETVLRGTPASAEVTIQVLGGRIGTAFQHCPESAAYEKGEKVLVFLREVNGKLWNTGWLQGKYALAPDGVTVRGDEHLPIERDSHIETVRARVQAVQPSATAAPALRTQGGSAPRAEPPAAGPRGQGGVR
jgi:hypothetical protein